MKINQKELTGIKEIARRAKVSIGTVDRVIHNRTGVSDKTKRKVQAIIAEIDYQPNLLGRRLASNKITRLATLIPSVSEETSFWEGPLKGIEDAESEIRQYNVKIEKYFFDQDDKTSFLKQANKIIKDKPDGVLLAPSFIDESINFTAKCKKLNIPYVFIDSDIPEQSGLSYIGPDLYSSGYLAANLISYLIKKNDHILIVNISREMENDHHLLRKEDGFRGYFKEYNILNPVSKVDIKGVDYNSVKRSLNLVFKKKPDIKLVFVTNSRVSTVAHFLQETKRDPFLVGYDFLKETIRYLEEDVINFLICQKPGAQAYKGIKALYKHIVLKLPVEECIYMPINIVMKSNYKFYSNY